MVLQPHLGYATGRANFAEFDYAGGLNSPCHPATLLSFCYLTCSPLGYATYISSRIPSLQNGALDPPMKMGD